MSTLIRDARARAGVGLRDLARRAGVSAPTVLGWERSEAQGVIQIDTLRDALDALGMSLTVSARPRASVVSRLERREDRLGLELHRTIATKLIADPDVVLRVASENVPRIRGRVRGAAAAWVDAWERLVDERDLGGLVAVMLGTTRADIDMRSVSPFSGLLTEDERLEVLRRAT